ncbi:MliC family protein [Bradyrhizobium sp. JYMT SZCCT0180]|uniref:MliC family protein n=1 Tax=Bradyrhizobium sp. JYMT SZCCT0180 TaxID=2807666 RepID=UPI0032E00313
MEFLEMQFLCGDRAGVCRVLPSGLYSGRQEENMNNRKIAGLAAALLLGTMFSGAVGSSAALAQATFKNYRCADGTQFIAGFFRYDSRAHLQLDGKAVTLKKGVALSGARYTARGITLKVTKAGLTTLKHAKRPVTACELT